MSNLRNLKVVDFTHGRSDSENINTDIPFTENFKETRTIQQANVVIAAYVNRNWKEMKLIKDMIPSKLSQLENDMGFINEGDIPTKTSDLINDSGFITNEDIPNIPTKTSDLINDSGYVDKDVNNLTNYYDKTSIDNQLNNKASINSSNTFTHTQDIISDAYSGIILKDVSDINKFTNLGKTGFFYKDGATTKTVAYNDILTKDDLYYKPQDQFKMIELFSSGGCITGAGTEIHFGIILPKSMNNINTILISNLVMYVRSINGSYIINGTDVVGDAEFTVTSIKCYDNMIRVIVKKNISFGVTNNTPVNVQFRATIDFS